ncbi:DUF6773 family protein [Nodosilinea sp. P-1105]|uniref:DUF6773 family protein n=1 Tax=Nodosilinea sp. P-1105 TaxID=2546229 RepID=UPI00146C3588|nr:DUF6773 family protein [Nodosilinea sp. P-1105]NMF86650.1 hypothetical protein [Nodosilinea sp. P-1105]
MPQPSKQPQPYRNQIFQEGFYLLFFGLCTLLIVRVVLLGEDPAELWDFSGLFLATSLYLTVRLTLAKSMHQEYEKAGRFSLRRLLFRSFIASVFFSALMILFGAWSISTLDDVFRVIVGGSIYFALMIAIPLISHQLSKR